MPSAPNDVGGNLSGGGSAAKGIEAPISRPAFFRRKDLGRVVANREHLGSVAPARVAGPPQAQQRSSTFALVNDNGLLPRACDDRGPSRHVGKYERQGREAEAFAANPDEVSGSGSEHVGRNFGAGTDAECCVVGSVVLRLFGDPGIEEAMSVGAGVGILRCGDCGGVVGSKALVSKEPPPFPIAEGVVKVTASEDASVEGETFERRVANKGDSRHGATDSVPGEEREVGADGELVADLEREREHVVVVIASDGVGNL